MLKLTQAEFEALSLDEKLLWLYRETQNGVDFDNRLSQRIGATANHLSEVADAVKKLEQDK